MIIDLPRVAFAMGNRHTERLLPAGRRVPVRGIGASLSLARTTFATLLRTLLLAALLGGSALAAQAQELVGLAGALQESHRGERTFSGEIEYRQRLGDFLDLSGAWINEGHVPGHHRDGGAAQLWVRTNAWDRRLTVAAGIGPYFFFDTVPAANPSGSHDDHGQGLIASLAATWHLDGPWSVQLRANRVAAYHSVDTTSLLLGVGYRLQGGGASGRDSSATASKEPDREISLVLGRTILNTLESEDAFATQVEYRTRLGPYFAWSVSALNEGDEATQRRSGVTTQFWVGRAMPDERVTMAIGIGPYVILDIRRNPRDVDEPRERLAGILSLTTAYAPTAHWAVRLTWSRVVAEKSHDTDVLLLGAGYRF